MTRPFRKSDTGSWIEVTGFVKRLISDDNDGSGVPGQAGRVETGEEAA